MAYTFPTDSLVTTLKYDRNLAAARPLAFMLTRALDHEPYPDVVVPMPIAPAHLAARGFNHAEEIARFACREYGLELSNRLVHRIGAGVPQASLPWKERARNVRGVFACSSDLTGRTIAVVDDVLTTGATLNELASLLKRCGANKVVGWVAARTPARN